MIVYHYSATLKEGDRMIPGYQNNNSLCEPFIQALEHSQDCLYGMLLNGKYMYAVMSRSGLREWANYAKWATEAIFEYVRKNEYPQCVSRLRCNYFCVDLSECIQMYNDDWGEASPEEQAEIHLYEIEISDKLEKRDITVFDEAYEAISKNQDIESAFRHARRYFGEEYNYQPIWEYLSAEEAIAKKDITEMLKKQG